MFLTAMQKWQKNQLSFPMRNLPKYIPIWVHRSARIAVQCSVRLDCSQSPVPYLFRHRRAQRISGAVFYRPIRWALESCCYLRSCTWTEMSPDCDHRMVLCCWPSTRCFVSSDQIVSIVVCPSRQHSAGASRMSLDCWLQFKSNVINQMQTIANEYALLTTQLVCWRFSTVFRIQFSQFYHIIFLHRFQILILRFQFLQIREEILLNNVAQFLNRKMEYN